MLRSRKAGILTALLMLLAPVSRTPVAAAPLTLEEVLAFPFPSQPAAAPKGNRFAWILTYRGDNNIWIGEPGRVGRLEARALTHFTGDTGHEIADLQWNPSGDALIFTRSTGGSPDRPANAASLAGGGERPTIWILPAGGGAPRSLGEGYMPTVSPDGRAVAFLRDDRLWVRDWNGAAPPRLAIADKGRVEAPAWSPDGSRIAFISRRGDHNLIGVLDVARDVLTWMAPGLDLDMAPSWSPDGSKLAFIRIPAEASALLSFRFLPRPEGPPWSIWVVDPGTGEGREVWKAQNGQGSVYHAIGEKPQLLWTADGAILFPWERSGWLQLYKLDLKRQTTSPVTPGASEVFTVTLSPDRRSVVYSSNSGDIDRRHIWRARLDGVGAEPLSRGSGVEDWPSISSDGRTVLAFAGAGRDPMRPVLLARVLDVRPLDRYAVPFLYPEAKLVEPQQVVFPASDGLQIHAQLFAPPGNASPSARKPAILFFHGGPARQTLLGWHPSYGYSLQYAMNQYLAARGYVVLSVNYRGGEGYGLGFREAPGFSAAGASELKDIEGAIAYLRQRSDVDPKRLGIWGGSYGGRMTSLALAALPDAFAAGVAHAGNHDIVTMRDALAARGMALSPAPLAWESSAISRVNQWRTPILLAHADDDRNVPFSQTIELAAALKKAGVPYEILVLANETHGNQRLTGWLRYFRATSDFFDRHLKPGPAKRP